MSKERPPRQVFGERFELLYGEGFYGDEWHPDGPDPHTFTARDLEGGPNVLLALWGDRYTSPLEVEQLERATRTLGALGSFGWVPPAASGLEAGNTFWFAFTIPPGKRLDRRMGRGVRALPLMLRLCRALGEAQARGLVMRHLRPEHVFIEGESLHLLAPGTAPERFRVAHIDLWSPPWGYRNNFAPMDARSDVWSLGRLLWRMATGTTPATPEDEMHGRIFDALLSPVLWVIGQRSWIFDHLFRTLKRCLESDRERRPPDAASVGKSLLPSYGRDDELSRAIAALPPARPEQIDWPRVEQLAQERLERSRRWERPSRQPLYDLTEARRMRAAQLASQGRRDEAMAVLERALADDPNRELEQAHEALARWPSRR